jgi:hypothetical protein
MVRYTKGFVSDVGSGLTARMLLFFSIPNMLLSVNFRLQAFKSLRSDALEA